MTRSALAALALALAWGPAARAQVAELRPVDEAAREAGFFTFRAHLQAAVARHDTAAVLAVVDPGVRNTFGDDEGIRSFRELWRPGDPGSALWQELGLVLALGGSFDGDSTFVAPYVFSRWPGHLDAFSHVAIIGNGVLVRAAPDPAAAPIGRLGFAIVPRADPPAALTADAARQWTPVRLRDGRVGYVAARYARSPVDYRAIFRRGDRGWRLVTLVAGD